MISPARLASAALLFGVSLVATGARAQGQPTQGHEPPGRIAPVPGHAPPPGNPNSARPLERRGVPEHGAPGAHAEHGAPGAHAEHGGHAEHDENAPPGDINWWHGLIAEKEGAEPGLFWRPPGEPPPFLATLLNFGLLAFLAVKFGKKPLRAALVKRKESIVHELEEAKRLREAAEKRLAEYEAKLGKIHEDLERVRREFRQQGEEEKERIVAEAKERRERLKKDAELLLSQEVKQLRQELVMEVVREATHQAAELLSKDMTLGDHDRFAELFLAELRTGGKGRASGVSTSSAAAKGSAS